MALIDKDIILSETRRNSNRQNKRAVRAIVLPLDKKLESVKKSLEDQTGFSKELPEDPFEALVNEGQLVDPPFDMLTLAMLNEHNSELNQCLDAMVANIDGFGHRFVPRIKLDPKIADVKMLEEVKKEHVKLNNFFDYACLEDNGSFVGFRKKLRKDIESTGNGWFEIIRGVDGEIQGFNHLPAYQMRLGPIERKPIRVDMPVLEQQIDGSYEVKNIKVWRRFRVHGQAKAAYYRNMMVATDYSLRYFKDFGDPRVYDNETGLVVEDPEKLANFPEYQKANEVIHMSIYSPRSPYGLPRFIGNLLGIFGDRAAEEINYITFRNNNIPSMALLISNGQLTEATIKRLESFVESQIQGSDNYSKFLIIEGESSDIDGEEPGQVKIDIKQLAKEQHVDELFQNYSKNIQDKVRRAFRLPPVLVGKTDDYSRNTVESSSRLADEQIFAPERDEFDRMMNMVIFPSMGIKYHKFKSNSPNTTDNQELVRILAGAEKTGGMTPRIARTMLEDILGIELPEFPKEFPADLPFSMIMAEAVKNKADPTEPGQQVTALKSLFTNENVEAANKLLEMNKKIEEKWRSESALSKKK